MKIAYQNPKLLLVILLVLWGGLVFTSYAKNVKDSIDHVPVGKLVLQLNDTSKSNKIITVFDSLKQELFEIKVKNGKIQKLNKSRLLILNDTSYLLNIGTSFYSDTVRLATLSKSIYLDYNPAPTVNIQINSESLLNQGEIEGFSNNKYNRTNINFKILKKNLPFDGGYLFNTDNSISNPWLGFYLNFDFEKYLAEKKKQLEKPEVNISQPAVSLDFRFDKKIIEDSLHNKKLNDSLPDPSIIKDSLNHLKKVRNELSNTTLPQKQIGKGDYDSLSINMPLPSTKFPNNGVQDSIEHLKGMTNINSFHSNSPVSKDSIQLLKQKYLSLFKQKQFLTRITTQDFGNLPLNSRNLKKNKFGEYKSGGILPKPKLKSLSIGRIFPEFGPLVLTNFSLTGVRTQVKIGNFGLEGFGGYQFQQNQTSFGQSLPNTKLLNNSQLWGIQPSYKISSGIQLFGSYLNGNNKIAGDYNRLNLESSRNRPINSEVLGLGFLYKITRSSFIRVDWARSIQKSENSELSVKEKMAGKMLNAFSIDLITNLKRFKTNLDINIRRIDPYFFSPGTPFLRKDVMAYKFRVNQPLLKGNVNLSFNYELNKDNIYKIRPSSQIANILMFKINARLKKKLSIGLMATQTYQKSIGEFQTQSKGKIYQATLNKSVKSKKSINNYLMIYSFMNIDNPESRLNQHNLSLIAAFSYPKLGLTITNSISGMRSSIGDSIGFTMAEIQLSKSIKSWISVSGGLNATELNSQLNRLRIFGILNFNIGKITLSPYIEKYWLTYEKEKSNYLFKINFFLLLHY